VAKDWQAEWSAKDGEVVGKVKRHGTGGWLMLDRSYEDVVFRALFLCTGGSEAGILLRIKKTSEGMKGVLLSITNKEVTPYQVSLDAQGKELQREKLRPAGGIFYQLAPLPNPSAVSAANRAQPPASPDVKLPVEMSNTSFRPGEWNQIEIFLDVNVIRTFLNDGSEIGGATEEVSNFGLLALHIGSTGEVRFKEIGLKDISLKIMPKQDAAAEGGKNTGVLRAQRNGMIVTSSGLIFSTAKDGNIYAFDANNGEILWTGKLPAGTEGLPAMYEVNGRSYLVVAATAPLV
jgi:hypothetical protein